MPSDRDLAQQRDWQQWLRPGDEKYTRGVDPVTGYLTLRLVTGLREILTAMFPDLPSAQRSGVAAHQHTEKINEEKS